MGDSKPSSNQPPAWYKESRKKDPSNTGSIVFTLLRIIEIPWQCYFLSAGLGSSLISRLGGTPQPLPATSTLGLGLHPYHTLILGLAAGTSASQVFWALRIRDNYFPPSGGVAVALYNTLLNTINSGLALWAVTCQAPSVGSNGLSWPLSHLLGVPMYLVGTYLERYSEVQRSAFKANPENKGKPYAGGLFSLVRNINYTGYTLMRIGFALVCGGWIWGALIGGVVFSDFAFRAVPWLEAYCEERVIQRLFLSRYSCDAMLTII